MSEGQGRKETNRSCRRASRPIGTTHRTGVEDEEAVDTTVRWVGVLSKRPVSLPLSQLNYL